MKPGTPCADAPCASPESGWLLNQLGDGFVLLASARRRSASVRSRRCHRPCAQRRARSASTRPVDLTQRYDGRPGTVYLIRPDQHVAARWRRSTPRDPPR
jgi:3-(3-hydroxy-phenyl)propionate hydroxylase